MKRDYPKIIYDRESKVLSIEVNSGKSIDSEIHDNVVIDYGKDNKVVRLNLYKFSLDAFRENQKVLKEFANVYQSATQ